MGIFSSKELPKPGLVPEYAIIRLEIPDGFLNAVVEGQNSVLLFSKSSGAGSSFQVIPQKAGLVSLRSVVLGKYITLDRACLRLLHYNVGGSCELWKLEGTLEACTVSNRAWNNFRMEARITIVAVPSDLQRCVEPGIRSEKSIFSAQSLLAQNHDLNRKVQILEIELQTFSNADSSRMYADLEKENGRLRVDVERLMSELSALSDKVKDQEAMLQQKEVQVKVLSDRDRHRLAALEENLHKTAEIERLAVLVKNAECEMQCQAVRVLTLEARVEEVQSEVAQATWRLQEVESQLKDQHMLEVTVEECKKEVASVEHETVALRSKLAQANNKFAFTHAEVIVLRRRIAELERAAQSDEKAKKSSSSKVKKLLTTSQTMKAGAVGMGSLLTVESCDRAGVLHSNRAAFYRDSFESLTSTATNFPSDLDSSPRASSPSCSSVHPSEDSIEPFVLSPSIETAVRLLADRYRRPPPAASIPAPPTV
mmetsp:Transcript_19405/g.33350  ORF Transcript_19405/g.33350 Transcript_19405/m.33350 type:complete len:482 (-) Transcript_19405:460-1905(-)